MNQTEYDGADDFPFVLAPKLIIFFYLQNKRKIVKTIIFSLILKIMKYWILSFTRQNE